MECWNAKLLPLKQFRYSSIKVPLKLKPTIYMREGLGQLGFLDSTTEGSKGDEHIAEFKGGLKSLLD